jgi:hypothetical protein
VFGFSKLAGTVLDSSTKLRPANSEKREHLTPDALRVTF